LKVRPYTFIEDLSVTLHYSWLMFLNDFLKVLFHKISTSVQLLNAVQALVIVSSVTNLSNSQTALNRHVVGRCEPEGATF